MFNQKKFSTSATPQAIESMWGGGHTPDTDPVQQGWQCRKMKGCDDYVIGQRGQAGSASVNIRTSTVDVGVYLEDPATVSKNLAKGIGDASFTSITLASGWGLTVLELITKERIEFSLNNNEPPFAVAFPQHGLERPSV
jgi:hypothetical protein